MLKHLWSHRCAFTCLLRISVRHYFRSINVYLGAILAISIVAITLVCWFAASRQNEQSVNAQKFVARHDTEEALEGLHVRLMQMAYWQDAYDNIARNWNQKWIAYQFGPYLDFYGIHTVAIFGPDDELRYLYASGKGGRVSKGTLTKAQGLTTLLKAVRSAPVRQPPHLREGMVVIAGIPYFASASIVTPENDPDFPVARERQFAVVVLDPATAAKFEALVEGYGVKDLRASPDGNVPEGLAAVAMPDAAGKRLAWLEWSPVRPGTNFLKAVVPPIVAVILLLAVVLVLVVRRWQKLQRALFGAEAKAVAAEEESQAKSAMLGNISHELRTPLNAIIGFSDLLLSRTFGPLGSPHYEEYAAHIKTGGHTLLKIVNDLIEIARIESHNTATECERIDAATAAQLAVEHLRERARSKNVELVLDVADGAGWCQGSVLNLYHAVERVLDNAVRHSADGDSVVTSVARDKGEVTVEVRDMGDGIPADRLAELGRPFSHAKSHLTRGNGGAGLGLSIVKGLMRLMGGNLSIASEEGMGTTVTLRLTAAEAPPIAAKIKKKKAA